MYAEVCFPFSLNKTFTYKVPPKIVPYLKPGTLVTVLFKNKKSDGFIISLSETSHFKGNINFIIDIYYYIATYCMERRKFKNSSEP